MKIHRWVCAPPDTIRYGDRVRIPSPNGWRETHVAIPFEVAGVWYAYRIVPWDPAHGMGPFETTGEQVWLPSPTTVEITQEIN